MQKKVIHTQQAPQAIGTYSQAIAVNGFLFLSGQIPLNPATMTLVEGGIGAQTKQVFQNIQAVLEEAGVTLQHVVKLTIYLTNLAHFAAVNEIMTEVFAQPYPARAVVQVSALPKGADIEVEAVSVL